MDINQVFIPTKELVIKYPSGKASDFKLQCASADSSACYELTLAQTQRDQERETPKSIRDLVEDKAEQMAACIVGWSGLTAGGVEVPYSVEEAKKLLIKPENEWIRYQVESFVTKRANWFLEGTEQA